MFLKFRNFPKRVGIAAEIGRVAIPALAACVIDPLLTLIDMSFVGNNFKYRLYSKQQFIFENKFREGVQFRNHY